VRAALFAMFALIASCAPQGAGCNLSATREFTFGNATADTITAQAIGASCDKAIGLFVVRDAEGYPIWSWSAPLKHAFGDVFAAEDTEHVQRFLDRWVQPVMATTSAAPAWSALIPGQTTLDELTYEDIRGRDLPMLCHFSGTARQICVFWEPAAGGAGHFLDRDVEETNL
jgi:hypothetical protein